jgi:hypothetical protein
MVLLFKWCVHLTMGGTMHYVRTVEETKLVAVEAIKLSSRKTSTYWLGPNSHRRRWL